MDQSPPSAAEPPRNHDRLNGWKEIASHFGKSVRTVQRWEKELRLPVHRIHTPNGEIVYALASELTSWQAANESAPSEENDSEAAPAEEAPQTPPPPPVGPRSPWVRRAAFFVVAAAISIGGWELLHRMHTPQITDHQPDTYRVEDDRIVILNSAGQVLWPYVLKPPQSAHTFRDLSPESKQRYLRIEDLDGDGKKEVLISLRPPMPAVPELVCLEADGRQRFTLRMPRHVMFGGKVYDPPFVDPAMQLVPEPTGGKMLWVRWNHNLMFPSVLQKVTPRGEPLAEFWANGHIQYFEAATRAGRRVMYVTAFNNERRAVSLAALDYQNPSGAMPAENPNYRCDDCPAGQPLEMFVFPRMELSRVKDTRPMPGQIKLGSADMVTISVDHVREPIQGAKNEFHVAAAVYTVDATPALLTAESTDSYRLMHARMRELGLIDHEYGPRDERELLPVLRWDGTRFQPQPLKPPTAK